jgi:hypothetical protein
LGFLISLILEDQHDLRELLLAASDLTPFAIEYRYPDAAIDNLNLSDVTNALNSARELVTKLAEKVASLEDEGIL